ncbi:MAG: hypothetical protein ACYC4L_08110 [Chloroflexota bacterium]
MQKGTIEMALMAFVAPILPGKTEQWRRFMDEVRGQRLREFTESRRRVGLHERTFFQSTPQGDFVIVTLEGDDPAGSFQRMATLDDDFTKWFMQQAREVHGIDLSQGMPAGAAPELVIDTRAGGMSQR